MQHFNFERIEGLEGAFLINPLIASDDRGYVIKDYHKEIFENNHIDLSLNEVFYTSSKRGVIRAMHFQTTKPQAKLVRCIHGRIYDVIVDLRIDSPSYKKWKSFELYEGGPELFIPHGFGHGYLVLEDSIVSYKCDEKFYGEYDSGIIWNDKNLSIEWPINLVEQIILSEKDKNLKTLSEYEALEETFKM